MRGVLLHVQWSSVREEGDVSCSTVATYTYVQQTRPGYYTVHVRSGVCGVQTVPFASWGSV